jgi:hypothetical protein
MLVDDYILMAPEALHQHLFLGALERFTRQGYDLNFKEKYKL